METYKIIICDDQITMIAQIQEYLQTLGKENGYSFVTYLFQSGQDLLERFPMDGQIILLDIGMEGTDGMKTAKVLRQRGYQQPIIFITSMSEYALEGYSVHAFAFLEKPVDYAKFSKAILEIIQRKQEEKKAVLALNTSSGIVIIDLNELIYAEVFQHQMVFHMKDRDIESYTQLSSIEKEIEKNGIFRPHRSYLINLQKVERIEPLTIIMEDGSVIPLSKYRRKQFLDTYSSFMGVRL